MNLLRRLHHLARADFLERVRRHGFLVALLFCVYAAYAFLPPNPSSYITLRMDEYRGVYNSAWVGTAVAMLSAVFISLIGFYLVKNAVERDRRTGVGQILATTPVSRVQYTLGKTFSNFAVLAAMAGVVAVACVGMQWLRAEDRTIELAEIFVPFVLLALPPLLMTAAVAVCFETLPVLRGGMGNVIFFFAWGFLLGGAFDRTPATVYNDPIGTGIALPAMMEGCRAAFPAFDPDSASVSMGINIRDDGMWHSRTFAWSGIDWTPRTVGWRLSWVLVALAIAAVAAVPFDRFDPARQRAAGAPRRARRRWRRERPGDAPPEIPASDDASAAVVLRLSPLPADARGPGLGTMVRAEWTLLARGLRWWYAGPIAVAIAAFTAPLSGVRSIVLPLAWFWPVLLWSKLGTREATHQTEPVFFSAPRPLARQLAATWISGVMLAVLAAGPVAVRFVVAGEHAALLAWAVGAMFIPALALALGVWTRSGKFFEALHTALCYAVIQSATPLDFMGAIPAATARGNAAVFAVLTALLLAIALLGRRRRLRN